ncbi:hypothetical protein [Tolypothrix sp. VBCCA 56010]|uniref:hypothetical protein n=1 Tax=Tolypothrix sp. VBCCA 56010 TaxID=3137731 RepID=UPI003D7D0F71
MNYQDRDIIQQKGNFGVGVNKGEIRTKNLGGIINNEAQTKSLAEAAEEIQLLLKRLEKTNPTTTEIEKLTVIAKATEAINENPALKARIINALKAGGTEAFKEAVDHPLVNILVATIEGWRETK